MNSSKRREVVATLLKQGRRDLAEAFVKTARKSVTANPMDAARAMQAANKVDAADTLLSEAQKLLAQLPKSKKFSTQLGTIRKKLVALVPDIEDLG